MISEAMYRRKLEVDFEDPLPIDSTADLLRGPRTKLELPILISCLMEGDDPEALRREYGSELLEEAISVLENRIWQGCKRRGKHIHRGRWSALRN